MTSIAERGQPLTGARLRVPARFAAERHVPELDGLRALAITLVMLRHFTAVDAPAAGLGGILAATQTGWIGVDLFFVISGFLITGICLDHRGPGFLRAFYARRVLRIFPPYFALLAVCGMASLAFSRTLPRGFGWMLSFATNVDQARANDLNVVAPPLTHLWSLAIEEQFYLAWPFLAACLPRRRSAFIALAALPTALAYRLFLIVADRHVAAYVLTFARVDALAVGALLAFAVRSRFAGVLTARRTWIGVGALPLALVIGEAARYSCLAIGFGALLAVTCGGAGPVARLLRIRSVRWVGRRSYGMYLIHLPVVATLRALGWRSASGWDVLFLAVVATAITLGLAEASWRTIEKPALSLKTRVPYDAAATATMGAAHVHELRS